MRIAPFCAALMGLSIGAGLVHAENGPTTALAPSSAPASSEPLAIPNVKVSVPAELKAVLAEGIRLLEAGKKKEAIELIARPALIKEWMEKGIYDKVLADFDKDRIDKLLNALKAAQDEKAEMDEKMTVAKFDNDLNFIKEEGVWHLDGK